MRRESKKAMLGDLRQLTHAGRLPARTVVGRITMGRLNVWKIAFLGLMIAGWMLGFAPGAAQAAARERADGVLTEIENDGGMVSVLIDDKGFLLDPAVKIMNRIANLKEGLTPRNLAPALS